MRTQSNVFQHSILITKSQFKAPIATVLLVQIRSSENSPNLI